MTTWEAESADQTDALILGAGDAVPDDYGACDNAPECSRRGGDSDQGFGKPDRSHDLHVTKVQLKKPLLCFRGSDPRINDVFPFRRRRSWRWDQWVGLWPIWVGPDLKAHFLTQIKIRSFSFLFFSFLPNRKLVFFFFTLRGRGRCGRVQKEGHRRWLWRLPWVLSPLR